MADPASAAAIAGGAGNFAGGVVDAIGSGMASAKDNAKGATMAGNLQDFITGNVLNHSTNTENAAIDSLIGKISGPGDYSGLEAQANRELGRSSRALDASLASRGIFDSGQAIDQQTSLRTGVLGSLSDKINQDRLSRQQLAGTLRTQQASNNLQDVLGRLGIASQLYSNDAFGNYDTKTGQAKNQGK